ncbi:MFS transporter [Methylobacterium sp. C25]|uniref:MFS transporter n=1 Tax=Methylobacterium sp. C25 TaxID=2721622 RepID=UPI001F2CEB63|nr:MFS transporter [Methylobacterium sp. C25]MCE4223924.1 MFS transporter [Methylobacterium sp. C25]
MTTSGARGKSSFLTSYLALFAALYGGYGALSPFLPAYLAERGLSPQEITTFLAAATLTRLAVGPVAGRIADWTGRAQALLAACLALAGISNLALLAGHGLWPIIVIGIVQSIWTAPLAPIADALALAAAGSGRIFEYGWVRAAGSAAFIAATILTGFLVGIWGNSAGIWACGTAFAAAAVFALRLRLPPREKAGDWRMSPQIGFGALAAIPAFRRVVLAAALVIGAHAMHDAFTVIVWREAGISAGTAGLLWSESVAAEVLVFLWLGPRLLSWIGSPGAIALAAIAGALRWAVQGATTWLPALAAIQVLHGLTFAALHLACLALIERSVPDGLRATALGVYGALGLGLASALLTLAAGQLYGLVGIRAFWAMSALSLAAVPIALSLRGGK